MSKCIHVSCIYIIYYIYYHMFSFEIIAISYGTQRFPLRTSYTMKGYFRCPSQTPVRNTHYIQHTYLALKYLSNPLEKVECLSGGIQPSAKVGHHDVREEGGTSQSFGEWCDHREFGRREKPHAEPLFLVRLHCTPQRSRKAGMSNETCLFSMCSIAAHLLVKTQIIKLKKQ